MAGEGVTGSKTGCLSHIIDFIQEGLDAVTLSQERLGNIGFIYQNLEGLKCMGT